MKYLNFSNNMEFKMKLFYDFHIHSALSPCAENEMTPNNIVNMALLKDLDIISITDHNSIKNLEAFDFLTKSLDLLFVPGIEIQTSEDIHVICLFKTIHIIQYKRLIFNGNFSNLFSGKTVPTPHHHFPE